MTRLDSPLRIAIIGAGLGGLCLAQFLRRHGIVANVYERDQSLWDRPQGYRLHLDVDGIHALHDALEGELYALFDATAMKAQPFTTIVDTALRVRMRRGHDEHGGTQETPRFGLPSHVNVHRATLREILLARLEDRVHLGRKLAAIDEHDGVTLTFDDGARIDADVVVGADGIRSLVRRRRAPHLETQDSGVRAIYGRIPMAAALPRTPQHVRDDVFTVAVDERKCFLGLGPVVFPFRPEAAASRIAPAPRVSAQEDYVVSIVGGRRDLFPGNDDAVRAMTSTELQSLARAMLDAWPEETRRILDCGDPTSFFWVEMYTSVPGTLPLPRHTALLGDAIHAMTPTLGRGANLALRDAVRLGRQVLAIARGETSIANALAAYEGDIVPYGFDVVRAAAEMGARLMGQDPLPA